MSSVDSKTRILDSALDLITRRGDAAVTMAQIAKAAGMSRQAVYLHYSDRGELMVALARHADEKRGLSKEIQKIAGAPTALDALREMVLLQARMNPAIWAVARAFEAVRRSDPAVERSWQDRLQNRLEGCRRTVQRLQQEGLLQPELTAEVAADLLWSLTSLRTWEDLVLERKWSAARYQDYLTRLLLAGLTVRK